MSIFSLPFPIKFENSEYNKCLGVYQKWIKGDNTKRIEKMFSFSAFHYYDNGFCKSVIYNKYAEYLYLTILAITEKTPDYIIRIYIDDSIIHYDNPDRAIWIDKFDKIYTLEQVQLIAVKFPRYYLEDVKCHDGFLPVMFRYLSLFDTNISIILFRDIDNIYTDQHEYFVKKWLEKGTDTCFYMNDKYRRKPIIGLTPTGTILDDTAYTIILSGMWNIKKQMDTRMMYSVWQKIFGYIENYTSIVFDDKYKGYKYYGKRFIYGFDELALTKVLLPIFIKMGMSIYTIPVKIYNVVYFRNMFDNITITKFLRKVSDDDTIAKIRDIVINRYWDLTGDTAGLAQYIIGILSNIYFGVITKQSKFHTNNILISNLKYRILPNVLLMAIGIFNFGNFKKYKWFDFDNPNRLTGSKLVTRFLETNQKITYEEWTADIKVEDLPSPTPDTGIISYNI